MELTEDQRKIVTVANLNTLPWLHSTSSMSITAPLNSQWDDSIGLQNDLKALGLENVYVSTLDHSTGNQVVSGNGERHKFHPDSEEAEGMRPWQDSQPVNVVHIDARHDHDNEIYIKGEQNLKLLADLGLKFPASELYAGEKAVSMVERLGGGGRG